MTTQAGDWRAHLDDVDAAIVDGYQSEFPLERRPFSHVGDEVGVTETTACDRVERLLELGILRRFGPVLNPPVIGSSTLAALQAPAERFDEIAAVVNEYPQVNHNYARDHAWNMWFVVTAGSRATRDRIVDEIEERTGCEVLVLPMVTDYYIDLEFPVVNRDRFAGETGGNRGDRSASDPGRQRTSATRISEDATEQITPFDAQLILDIQAGFPLTETPYADLADRLETDTDRVLAALERLLESGCIKRIGCIVNHLRTGFDANCMVVWDVPDEDLDDRGEVAGALPYVTLCYHRPRRPAQGWQYNLFTMIHGRDQAAVDARIDELATDYLPVEHERLYSTETLKQTGARYEALLTDHP